MATLPDLNTDSIGFVAYWNAIDDGGIGTISPEEALSSTRLQEYTLYDNGWEGQYQLVTGRVVQARVKSDGWFVVYIDRSKNFGQSSGGSYELADRRVEAPQGYWDLITNWSNPESGTGDLNQNALERAINELQSNLSNSESITYNAADTGLYCYEYTGATTATLLSQQVGETGLEGSQTAQGGAIYTSGTNLHEYIAVGSVAQGDSDPTACVVNFEGTTVAETDGEDYQWGSLDLLEQGLAPNADTEYTMTSETHGDTLYGSNSFAQGNVFAIWS